NVFFFSSRRRHTRFDCDWSSDVCSSDLLYKIKTPGTQVLDNTTTILDEDSEPQPDLTLRVLPEFGGQSKTSEDDYVLGSPELLRSEERRVGKEWRCGWGWGA